MSSRQQIAEQVNKLADVYNKYMDDLVSSGIDPLTDGVLPAELLPELEPALEDIVADAHDAWLEHKMFPNEGKYNHDHASYISGGTL